jgi:hypothetical protein
MNLSQSRLGTVLRNIKKRDLEIIARFLRIEGRDFAIEGRDFAIEGDAS